MNVQAPRRLLVVGARQGSLGEAIADAAQKYSSFDDVLTADHPDVCNVEAHAMIDVTDRRSIITCLENTAPTDVVCCVGRNLPDGETGEMFRNWSIQMQINAWGPTMLLGETLDIWSHYMLPPPSGFNFVAISSNSARIARSQSAGYCASKAALSMTLQCVARKIADTSGAMRVWGYEPGWINDTRMSEEVRMRLKPGVPVHRIPGGVGLRRGDLAHRVVSDLRHADRSLNGCIFRIDGGEQ